MRADMRNKITILQKSISYDSFGTPVESWSNAFSDIWASKESLLGNEFYNASATQSKVEVKFRTYHFNGVTNQMRILCDGETFEILSAINVKSLNRELLMYCKKVS